MAVGIGDGVNRTNLAAITGDDSLVFTVPKFEDLSNMPFLQKILKTTCSAGMTSY